MYATTIIHAHFFIHDLHSRALFLRASQKLALCNSTLQRLETIKQLLFVVQLN